MVEKIKFEMSGLVKNDQDIQEIEFWGHDAGEFVYEAIEEIVNFVESSDVKIEDVGKEQ